MARVTKKEMISFLREHFRYFTHNSWNRSTSYAANVKIYNFVPADLRERAYEMLEVSEPFLGINKVLNDFARRYNWQYQIWWNGRSNGYLVLGQGGLNEDGSVFMRPGLGMDEEADFEDWDYRFLRKRYNLVRDFDSTVEKAKQIFLWYCKNFRVVEKERKIIQRYKTVEPIAGRGSRSRYEKY